MTGQGLPDADPAATVLQELTSSSEAWQRFETAVRSVTEWLDKADQMLTERADTEPAVEEHKVRRKREDLTAGRRNMGLGDGNWQELPI